MKNTKASAFATIVRRGVGFGLFSFATAGAGKVGEGGGGLEYLFSFVLILVLFCEDAEEPVESVEEILKFVPRRSRILEK